MDDPLRQYRLPGKQTFDGSAAGFAQMNKMQVASPAPPGQQAFITINDGSKRPTHVDYLVNALRLIDQLRLLQSQLCQPLIDNTIFIL